MKNILFIVHCIPFPLSSGGRQAIFNSIISIQEHHNLFITYPFEETIQNRIYQKEFERIVGPNVKLLPYVGKTPIIKKTNVPIKKRIVEKLRLCLEKISPSTVIRHNPYYNWIEELFPKSVPFSAFINNIIEQNNIDIVQCEMLRNLAFVLDLPQSVRKVFVHHELGFVRHELELSKINNDFFDGNAYLQAAKIMEVGLLNRFDKIITLSHIDSKKLKEAGVTSSISDSFAVVKSSSFVEYTSEQYKEIAFIGPDNHLPNVAGLNWFLDNCWQSLLNIDKKYQLSIIGLWSEENKKILSIKHKNLRFLGFVENLDKALQDKILIVPITIGSGIRMKILEASTRGIPFVSTTIGAEGIPVVHQTHCLLADTPDEFINSILALKDPELRIRLVSNANQMVNTYYSLDALGKNRLKIYDSLYE